MLTVNELFSGIGSQRAALERLGIEHKVVGIAEIDKFAIKSYEAIWGETRNYGDISKVDKLNYADFWTYSFPCQDISVAGKQEGIKKGKTRSGLLYEVERLLEVAQEHNELPKYLMLENVKNLVGKKFKPQFEEWITRLDELGYNTYWQVLNAKNYGIPQNRERVFGISIRKDSDTGYVFPEPFELNIRLKDILEDEVDEKFYLSEEYTKRFAKSIKSDKFPFGNEYKVVGTTKAETERMGTNSRHWVYDTNDCMSTLDATMYKQPKQILEPSINQVGMLDIKGNEQIRRVYGDNGISPTLNTMQGGNRQPKVLIPQATKKGYIECNVPGVADLSYPDSKTRRGRVQEDGEIVPTLMAGQQDICYIEPNVLTPKRTDYGKAIRKDYESGLISESRHNMTEMQPREDGICNTLTTVQKDNYLATTDYRIRKLTPKECWRLMGFTDEQFHKAQDAGISNSQLYKQAGNSIVVDVLYYIFRNLFTEKPKYRVQIDDEEQLPGQISILDFMN